MTHHEPVGPPFSPWRLVLDGPLPGAFNMAADEAMLHLVAAVPATILRFYAWSQPTLSLGKSQAAASAADLDACRRAGIAVVRRPTGGQAVLHDAEITYSIASSHPQLLDDPSPYGPYRRVSAALMAGFERIGIPTELAPRMRSGAYCRNDPCFLDAGHSEILYKCRKIAGSAQWRSRDRFLQHGSILVDFDARVLARCTRSDAATLDSRVVPITCILGGITPPRLDRVFAAAFRSVFGIELEERPWSAEEIGIIRSIEAAKYATDAWTYER
ncbi:MAG: biotin/lipoate A/B protein ligase family protein [Acidobacteriota bacterium]